MAIINKVISSSRAKKELQKIPRYIVENLAAWIEDVEHLGLNEVRKIANTIEFVSVEEVNKHEY